jgi:hypothetical protein
MPSNGFLYLTSIPVFQIFLFVFKGLFKITMITIIIDIIIIYGCDWVSDIEVIYGLSSIRRFDQYSFIIVLMTTWTLFPPYCTFLTLALASTTSHHQQSPLFAAFTHSFQHVFHQLQVSYVFASSRIFDLQLNALFRLKVAGFLVDWFFRLRLPDYLVEKSAFFSIFTGSRACFGKKFALYCYLHNKYEQIFRLL